MALWEREGERQIVKQSFGQIATKGHHAPQKIEVPVPLPGEKRYQDTPCREIRQQTQQDTRHRAEDGGNQATVMILAQLPQPQQWALCLLHK